jgi:hypothetical protein
MVTRSRKKLKDGFDWFNDDSFMDMDHGPVREETVGVSPPAPVVNGSFRLSSGFRIFLFRTVGKS